MQKELTNTDRLEMIENQLEYILERCDYHFENGSDSYAGVLYAEYKEWLESEEECNVAWAPDVTS